MMSLHGKLVPVQSIKGVYLIISSQIKSVAAEERRIQQQIVAQQKKELANFLENQKKEYRFCKDKIKEVNITNKHNAKFMISLCSSVHYEMHSL